MVTMVLYPLSIALVLYPLSIAKTRDVLVKTRYPWKKRPKTRDVLEKTRCPLAKGMPITHLTRGQEWRSPGALRPRV